MYITTTILSYKDNNLSQTNGTILLIVALFLPIILIILSLIINIGTMSYSRSTYTSVANTAASSAISVVGDEMVDIVNAKISNSPPYIPVSENSWENLTDTERIFLTTNSEVLNKIKNEAKTYLQKNTSPEALMRNDITIKDIIISYPYQYTLSDEFVKLNLKFLIESPVSLASNMNHKDILIEVESQVKIK